MRVARLGENRLHHEARAEHKSAEPVSVGVEIGDWPARDSALHRRARDRGRDAHDKARVKRARDQRGAPERLRLAAIGARNDIGRRLARQRRDRADRRFLHLFVDRRGADVERAAKNIGKAKDVVDLIGIVGAAGADHRIGARGDRKLGHDLRCRIGQREDQRIPRHLRDELRLQNSPCGKAQENIGAFDDVLEGARRGLARVSRLPAVHQFLAALVDDALDVADENVFFDRAERDEKIERSERGRACARDDDLDLVNRLACEFERIGHRRRDDDRGAVLVVVKDGNAHASFRPFLDVETFRPLDVLEVDAAEGWLERDDDVDELVDVGFVDLDVEDVDARELLEEYRLALHHRLTGERADRAEAEHCGAVGEHGDEILARRQMVRLVRVRRDRLAGEGDARRIGEREVALIGERLCRRDLQLAGARLAMEMQGVGFKVGRAFACHISVPCKVRGDSCPGRRAAASAKLTGQIVRARSRRA